jgi:hypothetical protein
VEEVGGKDMKSDLNDEFFDLTCRVLNYAIEFVNAPGYASLRLVDILKSLIYLQPQIDGVSRGEFYQKLREKLDSRDLLADEKRKSKLLDELLTIYVDEWRSNSFRV